MHGQLGVEEAPLAYVERRARSGRRVDARQQALHRRDRLALHQAGWPHPHHTRPRLVDAALDPPPLDRVEVAAVPLRRARPLEPSSGVCGERLAPGARPVGRPGGTARLGRRRRRGRGPRRTARDSARATERPGRSTRARTATGPTGTGPQSSIVNRPITRSVGRVEPLDAAGQEGRRRAAVLRVGGPRPGGRRQRLEALEPLVGDAGRNGRSRRRQPISRTPVPLCIVLRRCPFSSVGRASPW